MKSQKPKNVLKKSSSKKPPPPPPRVADIAQEDDNDHDTTTTTTHPSFLSELEAEEAEDDLPPVKQSTQPPSGFNENSLTASEVDLLLAEEEEIKEESRKRKSANDSFYPLSQLQRSSSAITTAAMAATPALAPHPTTTSKIQFMTPETTEKFILNNTRPVTQEEHDTTLLKAEILIREQTNSDTFAAAHLWDVVQRTKKGKITNQIVMVRKTKSGEPGVQLLGIPTFFTPPAAMDHFSLISFAGNQGTKGKFPPKADEARVEIKLIMEYKNAKTSKLRRSEQDPGPILNAQEAFTTALNKLSRETLPNALVRSGATEKVDITDPATGQITKVDVPITVEGLNQKMDSQDSSFIQPAVRKFNTPLPYIPFAGKINRQQKWKDVGVKEVDKISKERIAAAQASWDHLLAHPEFYQFGPDYPESELTSNYMGLPYLNAFDATPNQRKINLQQVLKAEKTFGFTPYHIYTLKNTALSQKARLSITNPENWLVSVEYQIGNPSDQTPSKVPLELIGVRLIGRIIPSYSLGKVTEASVLQAPSDLQALTQNDEY